MANPYGWRDGHHPARQLASIQGAWPEDLRGYLLRNGPGLFWRGEEQKAHLFDGDGFVQLWCFGDSGPSHRSNFVHTDKYNREQQAGQFLYPGFASPCPPRRVMRRPDDINTANTNLIELGGSLYALWEAGSAHEIEPASLNTIGIKTWSKESAGIPFGAHPKRDQDGTLWNIGFARGQLVLYEISAQGALRRMRVHHVGPSAFVHDFVVTERYLIVWLAPLQLDATRLQQGILPLDAMKWDGDSPSRLVVIDRDRLEIEHVIECEPDLIFHFANGWDSGDEIHLHYVKTSFGRLKYGLSLKGVDEQNLDGSSSYAVLRHVQLQSGRSTLEPIPGHVEFPQIDLRWTGRKHRYAYHLERYEAAASQRGFNAVQCTDLVSNAQQHWVFPSGIEAEEHVFVPFPGGDQESDGWLVGTGFDSHAGASFCSVFHAQSIAQGPLAMAYLDGEVPPCFHGSFVRTLPVCS